MKKEPVREFTMEDAVMLVEGQLILTHLKDNLSDFTTQFNDFESPFVTNMQSDIDVCNSATSDEVNVAQQHIQTVNIDGFMNDGRIVFQDTFLYVKLAFPENLAMQKLYGHHLYQKTRVSHIKFPNLLMQAFNMANDPAIKPKLIAKGATDAGIALLESISIEISAAVQKQQKLIGARSLSTQDRVNNLNVVWKDMSLISECSKQVYKDNPAKRKLFLLYHD